MTTGPRPASSAPLAPRADPADVARARAALADVDTRFGHRLLGLPGTWLGALGAPAPRHRGPLTEWHYWWQAQYLDSLLDGVELDRAAGAAPAAEAGLRRAQALLRGILLRNGGRFPNYFFDDMAWLALAAERLLALAATGPDRPTPWPTPWARPLARWASATLTQQLHGAHDLALGGGLWWSKKRDYKNTPVNGPAALHFAREGEAARAQAVADWLRAELFDPEQGLYLDGVHPTGREVERNIFTYNQGPILAALLRLEDPRSVAQAAELITAIATHLSTPGRGLRLEPGGDGSLFTGILCRYLAVAATEPRLPTPARSTAARLVRETADALSDPAPASLSAAVQRATIYAAAARCPAA